MSEDFIQVQPDSTGKRLRAIKRNVGGIDVYEEIIQIAEPAAGSVIDPRQIRTLASPDQVDVQILGSLGVLPVDIQLQTLSPIQVAATAPNKVSITPGDTANTPLWMIFGNRSTTFPKGQVSIGTTQVSIANVFGLFIWVKNIGTTNIYIGGTGVTTANGYKLPPGEEWDTKTPVSGNLFGISDAAGGLVSVIEQ